MNGNYPTTSTQEGEQHCGQKYSVHYELRTAPLYRLVGIPGNREKASSLHFDSFHHSTNQLSTISPRIRFPPISEDTLTRMQRRFLTFIDETTYLSFPPFYTNNIQVSICAYFWCISSCLSSGYGPRITINRNKSL